ncbi:MAG TPA: glycine cleavage T C-terminal barrel domain-containing protein [Myxococcaceae bacterium]|nr:glycine cleavage T C-terminal barrel domain-containing protein [Myxococcaceae bacterium]
MVPLLLHSRHAALGATFGELKGREVVERTSGHDEDRALRTGAGLFDASAREVVRVTGPDRVSFLQGMVTQDVEGLPEGSVADAALLTARGAMVADARVVKRADDLLLLTEPGYGPVVLAALERYLISEDAELSDATASFGQLSLVGPGGEALASRVLGLGPPSVAALRAFDAAGVTGWALPQGLQLPGVDLLLPVDALGGVFDRLREGGATPVGLAALEVLRVEQGTPRFGADMDERTIPLEANLQRALHYQKGCYIGQEVIARATFRGHVNRHLVGLRFAGAPPPPRTELFTGDRRVGWVTSALQSPRLGPIGLGYVHRDVDAPGTELGLAAGGGKATVAALPFG